MKPKLSLKNNRLFFSKQFMFTKIKKKLLNDLEKKSASWT